MNLDVRTRTGFVRGLLVAEVAVFRGIPFASLQERFSAPLPALPWDGVRDAAEFGPPPPQSGAFGMNREIRDGDDWLTVNVWSPDLNARLPVMVWIQGGAYMFGTSGLPEYDGMQLASEGVVVVTFNYRVGLEGFGLVPEMPANRGLLDQVAALTWVQENISGFGGDPDRVTVFGQSAGGGSVAALLAMPRAAGLFGRAIAQSVPGTFFTPELAADITAACASELGVAASELSSVDPHILASAGDSVMATMERRADRWGLAARAGVPFAPVVDGDVLPTTPWLGLTGKVDLLAGHTRDEQRLLSVVSELRGSVSAELAASTADEFAPAPERYRECFPDPEELYEVVRSDWLFRMPSLHLAEAQRRNGGVAYLYELTWCAPGMGGIFGACHGLDVPLVFGNLSLGQPAMLIGEPSAEAEAVSRQMRAAWIGFAVDGDPGWPPYDGHLTRVFNVEPAVAAYPEQLSREIWESPPSVLDLV